MDWSGTTWTAIGGTVVAIVAILTLYFQLRDARRELQDKRIDEKIKGLIGENILLINHLTDQAKATLDEAKESAKRVQEIRDEANQTLQMQVSQSDESRQKLEETLQRADQVIARLDQTAQKAEEDSKAISEVRETVTHTTDILRRARNIGIKEGYRITGGVHSGALNTSMEWDTGLEQRRVHVEPLILGIDSEEAPLLLDPALRDSIYEALSREKKYHGGNTHFVIVTEKRPPLARLSGGPQELPIVAIDDFRQYLIDVKASTIPEG